MTSRLMGAGPRCHGSTLHPLQGSLPRLFFLGFVFSPAVLLGVAGLLAVCWDASLGHFYLLASAPFTFRSWVCHSHSPCEDQQLNKTENWPISCGTVFSTTYCLPFLGRSWGDCSSLQPCQQLRFWHSASGEPWIPECSVTPLGAHLGM